MVNCLDVKPTFEVEITEICPCRCIQCFNSWQHDRSRKPRSMSPEEMVKAVDIISVNGSQVVFTGGEPLINRETLIAGIERAAQKGLPWSLNSNLLLMLSGDPKYFKDKGINRVMVSVLGPNASVHDGITGVRGSFIRMVEGIRSLLDNFVTVVAHMPVTVKNLNFVEETGKLMIGMGVSFMATKAMISEGMPDEAKKYLLDKEGFRQYVDQVNKLAMVKERMFINHIDCIPFCAIRESDRLAPKRCYGGSQIVSVSPFGSISPCPFTARTSYGNIFKEDFPVIWDRMEEWRDGSLVPDGCRNCSKVKSCGGGCRAEALAATGDLCGIHPLITSNLMIARS